MLPSWWLLCHTYGFALAGNTIATGWAKRVPVIMLMLSGLRGTRLQRTKQGRLLLSRGQAKAGIGGTMGDEAVVAAVCGIRSYTCVMYL
jgi:hypothetical protein